MEDHSDLLDALSAIDPSTLNYQEWLNVGMALHESGLPLDAWDEWSRRDAGRYHEGECERKWRGFGSGQTRVKSGTLAKMATERGWVPPRASQGMGEALSWDGEISTALIDPSWVEPVELPETDKTGPEELVEYLGHLFDEDDVVGCVCESWDREGKWLPKSKGCYSRTAGELMRELKKYGSIEQAMGSYDDRAGAWIRINPLDGKGVGNANVSEFKYALVESDTLAKEKQLALMQELQLPCAAIVDSGKKSLHAVVKVDARDYNEYRDRVMRLYDVCRKNGLDPDTQNKNPSRLSRMPGAMRSGERQCLVSGPCGKASWSEWWDWMQETTDDLPDPENLANEWDDMPELAPPLIDGVLRQGHKMLLAGPSKAGKSFALIELCVSLAEGKRGSAGGVRRAGCSTLIWSWIPRAACTASRTCTSARLCARERGEHRHLEPARALRADGQIGPIAHPPGAQDSPHRRGDRPHLQGHHGRREQRRPDGGVLQPVRQGRPAGRLRRHILPPPFQGPAGTETLHGPCERLGRVRARPGRAAGHDGARADGRVHQGTLRLAQAARYLGGIR